MMVRDISYVDENYIPAPLDGPALRYTRLPREDVTDLAIHHMTGWSPPPDATVAQEIRFLRGIDEWHRSSRGLDGIGYQICVMESGRIYVTARLDRYGAAVGGHNGHIISIALPGDYTDAPPAPTHVATTVRAVAYVYGYLGEVA